MGGVGLGGQHVGRGTQPFYGDDFFDPIRVHPRILEDDPAAERVTDQGDRKPVGLGQQLGDIDHMLDHGVLAAAGPLRVPVSAQVGGDDVIVLAKGLGDPVPVPAVVPPAVNERHQRLVGIPPVDVVEFEALGVEVV